MQFELFLQSMILIGCSLFPGRQRFVLELWLKSSSLWSMEQMAVYFALDTPN